jgi:hypothetical protein
MALNTIGKLLGATAELKALTARTRRLRELQTLYLGSAPSELAKASRVKSYRAGTLVISTDNSAVAAKLKQLAPRVLAALRETADEVTAIRIEVQVIGGPGEARRKSVKTSLTPEAIEKFDELAKSVADEDLKAALTRLARRHGTRKSD